MRLKKGAFNMMANAKFERKKKQKKHKASSRTSFKPRIVDSSALIEEKSKMKEKIQQQADCRGICRL